MKKVVTIDVTDAVGTGDVLRQAVTVCVPDVLQPGDRPVVIFGLPGGGYNRAYFDLQIDGHHGYSEVDHHLGHGFVFVACDHLAVGDSDVPVKPIADSVVGAANALVARTIVDGLRAGTIDEALPGIEIAASIGIGQSYGGFVLAICQGDAGVFDGVGFLGWSGLQTVPPWPETVSLKDVVQQKAGNGLTHPMRPWFHYEDVPEDIVAADLTKEMGSMKADTAWSTRYMPGGPAVKMDRQPLDPGSVAAESAAIDVPVMVACGEIDVVADPWQEPVAYRGSPDVTVAVFPRMAHMHNFASSRVSLWDRLEIWANGVAATKGR